METNIDYRWVYPSHKEQCYISQTILRSIWDHKNTAYYYLLPNPFLLDATKKMEL